MGFEVQIYKRRMPEGTLDVDGEPRSRKYELHMNGKPFAAGMESIPEVIDEISETFNRKCDSNEVTVSSQEPEDHKLITLTSYERTEFVKRAPLLSYAIGFLPN